MKIVLNYDKETGAIKNDKGGWVADRLNLEDHELKEPILTQENLETLRKGWREIENTKEAWDECKKAHSKKDQMTEITIKVSDKDFTPTDGISCFMSEELGFRMYHKAKIAYKEAKAKEIKVGDWCFYEDNCIYQVTKIRLSLFEREYPDIKLPQNLQDGLNEFINEQKEK